MGLDRDRLGPACWVAEEDEYCDLCEGEVRTGQNYVAGGHDGIVCLGCARWIAKELAINPRGLPRNGVEPVLPLTIEAPRRRN